MAQSLRGGEGFAVGGVPETLRTPGYPLVLAAGESAGLDFAGIALLQHLLMAGLASAIFLLARTLTGSRRVALVAALLFAIDLPTIVFADMILTEALFTLLLFALLALAWRIEVRPDWSIVCAAAAGLVLGAAVLVRPVAIAFFVPLGAYFFWSRCRRAAIVLFVVCALLSPLLWAMRNQRATGVFTVSSIPAESMLSYRAAGVLALEAPGDYATNLKRYAAELRLRADAVARREAGVADVSTLPHAQLARWRAQLGREIVRQHPFTYARLVVRGVRMNLIGGDYTLVTELTGVPRPAAKLLYLAYTTAVFLLAAIGTTALLRTNRRAGALVAITLVYFLLLPAGAESNWRFRVPVMPVYVVAAAVGIDAVARRMQRADPGTGGADVRPAA